MFTTKKGLINHIGIHTGEVSTNAFTSFHLYLKEIILSATIQMQNLRNGLCGDIIAFGAS